MTCKDCIHYEACKTSAGYFGCGVAAFERYELRQEVEKDCSDFKPKSRYIELPCAVGDKVYWINRIAKEIETDIVISIHKYEDGFSITTKTIGTKCTSTYSLDRFLEIMHFTKEEAEAALERSEGK